MQQILLDTNIVIYLLKSDVRFLDLMEDYGDATFYISVVTWIEILAGSFHHQKDIDELRENLNDFILLPIDMKIGRVAAELIQDNVKNKRKKNFQDAAIAATAIAHNMPLVTNNPKDFRRFKGLKIISPRVRARKPNP